MPDQLNQKSSFFFVIAVRVKFWRKKVNNEKSEERDDAHDLWRIV